MRAKTKEEWVADAIKVHGDLYDYSKSNYINNYTEVIVICKKCGYEFKVIPYVHLRGTGCPRCGKKRSTSHMMTMEYFLEKSHERHGDKYDYSEVDLENRDEKGRVTIICPVHGRIKQKPSIHIKSGCKKCHMEKLQKSRRLTTETFIERARKTHGDLYDYSNTVYKNRRTPVEIKCNTCGNIFHQNPYLHVNGEGCPVCKFSGLENEIKRLLTENDIAYISQCKKDKLEWLGRQSLDFYLPDYNIAIECQGSFHFGRNDYFGGADGMADCRKRDERKYNICKENGVKILYYATSSNIPESYFDTIYTNTNDLLKELKKMP